MISIGGALGALCIGIAAPLLLKGYFELGITLSACAFLLAWNALAAKRWMAVVAFAVVCATTGLVIRHFTEYSSGVRVMVRNFYGVVRTRDFPDPVPFRVMYHGAINHGGQLLAPADRRRPSTYFGPTSGYGRTFASLRALGNEGPRRVG